MNLVTPKAKQATQLIMTCVIAGLCSWAAYGIVKTFPPPESVADISQIEAPDHIIISIMDLQREINRRYPDLNLKVDGRYGPLTQAAHEIAIGDQYAKKLMVWEVQ